MRAMKARITAAKAIGLGVLLQLAGGQLRAQSEGITALFPAQPAGYVTDVAGVVSPEDRQAMTDLIRRLKAATTAEIAVVTLPTIGDYAESQVALEIGRAWKVGAAGEIGERRNNGVVLLVVPRQNHRPGTGAVFIATGQGVEGMITDARAGQVRELMRPALSAEQYSAALRTGTEALVSLIARGYGVSDSVLTATRLPTAAPRSRGPSALLRLLPVVIFVVIMLALASRGGGGPGGRGRGGRGGGDIAPWILLGMLGGRGRGWGGGGWGGGFGGGGGGGFGGFGGGGGFSGGGAGGRF